MNRIFNLTKKYDGVIFCCCSFFLNKYKYIFFLLLEQKIEYVLKNKETYIIVK